MLRNVLRVITGPAKRHISLDQGGHTHTLSYAFMSTLSFKEVNTEGRGRKSSVCSDS